MKRFYVFGSVMEYMFHLHCSAESEEDAFQQWDKAFPKQAQAGIEPVLYPGDPSKDLYRYESGGYQYGELH